ncbi:hypothetical protein CEXT_233111 [Caerostris extrusa]|uniref:Uncharacterized protein n=1 Tax=Caerostris extrusa TaxID=172846 RepID=A0AAV4XSF6_CAEEX|nr:hypothetical protein CEXT_233111 [Caerostris extrusa]
MIKKVYGEVTLFFGPFEIILKDQSQKRNHDLPFSSFSITKLPNTTSSQKLISSKEGTRNSFSPRYDENSSSSEVKEKLMGSTPTKKFLLRNNRVSRSPSEAQGWDKGGWWKRNGSNQFSVIPR